MVVTYRTDGGAIRVPKCWGKSSGVAGATGRGERWGKASVVSLFWAHQLVQREQQGRVRPAAARPGALRHVHGQGVVEGGADEKVGQALLVLEHGAKERRNLRCMVPAGCREVGMSVLLAHVQACGARGTLMALSRERPRGDTCWLCTMHWPASNGAFRTSTHTSAPPATHRCPVLGPRVVLVALLGALQLGCPQHHPGVGLANCTIRALSGVGLRTATAVRHSRPCGGTTDKSHGTHAATRARLQAAVQQGACLATYTAAGPSTWPRAEQRLWGKDRGSMFESQRAHGAQTVAHRIAFTQRNLAHSGLRVTTCTAPNPTAHPSVLQQIRLHVEPYCARTH